MLGFPISTRQSIRNTIRFAKKIMPDIVRFFAVSPLPNTDLWDDIYGKGHIPEDIRWENIDFFKPSFNLKNIPREEISLYVTSAYWYVLKEVFLKEITVFLIPRMARLIARVLRTGKIRGNISPCFPRTVNLIVDNLHQLEGKTLPEILTFLRQVKRLERTFR